MHERHEQLPTGLRGFLIRMGRIDRRWIYLAVAVSISVPMLAGLRFPEVPGRMATATFDAIEAVPAGSRVLISYDFDPASAAELEPMANAVLHHCASKGHRIVLMALWPLGKQLADDAVRDILLEFHPEKVEGVDYVQLGFKTGNEGVIKLMSTAVPEAYSADAKGTPLANLPIMEGVRTVGDFDLVVSISGGTPGSKEWVQYADGAMPEAFTFVTGTTGVQASQLLPYYPKQMEGMLIAIKGAAEYEMLVTGKYPVDHAEDRLSLGRKRMGPQFVAHLLIIGLIVLGNVAMVAGRGVKGGRR